MRDNSEIKKLTKVNTETEFQPEKTFKIGSKCGKIFGRIEDIFMFVITSDFYRSQIQSRLRDVADDSLVIIRKFKFISSRGKSKTWDEWAAYFEQTDLNTLSLREQGILLLLCTHIQETLLSKVSDPSFSWNDISLEAKVFYLRSVLEIEGYIYSNHDRSPFTKLVHSIGVLFLSNELWINFFDVIKDYNQFCHEYVQIVLQANYQHLQEITVKGEKNDASTHNIKSLFWNPKAYDYSKKQGEIFDCQVSKLMQDFGGKYIIFEDGKVIDSDDDEMTLLDRIAETSFYRERPDAIFCTFVPRPIKVNV